MQATTWVDRITDERNPWLNAVKSEERGQLAVACMLYLEDAAESLGHVKSGKTALSVTCAADCAAELGFEEQSGALYREAGSLFCENARRSIGYSVREALWSLWQGAAAYQAGSDPEMADAVCAEYARIARRVDMFRGDPSFTTPERAVPRQAETRGSADDLSIVVEAVERFTAIMKAPRKAPTKAQVGRSVAPKQQKGGRSGLETSFANQLG